ncbi:MAG: exodeoxyribonuclease V subunit alpha [Thiolinea sp.]
MQTPAEHISFLDQQLAALLLKICKNHGQVVDAALAQQLTRLAQTVSAATRQGVIAVPVAQLDEDLDWPALQALPVLGQAGDYAPLILEDGHVWLYRYHQYEQRLASALQQRLAPLALGTETQAAIRHTLQRWHERPAVADLPDHSKPADIDWQLRAVALAACSRFLIISGGPGTGKTTTVTRLLQLLVSQLQITPERILLAAPTGKAAMRLLESIRQATAALPASAAERSVRLPEQAATLHRLLGYQPSRQQFRHHARHPLPADVVIVDEASMIDIALMTHLLEAVPPQARLILLGDRDQLASVETGSIFRDLCIQADNQYSPARQQQLQSLLAGSGINGETGETTETAPQHRSLNDHIVVLQKSWRFAADSGIGQLASLVREGRSAELPALLAQAWPDVHWEAAATLALEQLQQAWQDFITLVSQPATAGTREHWLQQTFAAFNRFRILTPLRQGSLGTEQLNLRISQYLRRQLAVQESGNPVWFPGRPVMVTQNDYRQQLFNGDIGLTLADEQGRLRVWFAEQDGFRAVSPVRLPRHETAWAMTIHKSQGSEFEDVLLILPDDEELRILGRELLYTGITRARSRIRILGRMSVLQRAVETVMPPISRIRERLE